MKKIEYFVKFKEPTPIEDIKTLIEGRDFSNFMSDRDKRVVNQEWARLKTENPRVFSGKFGCLYDSQNGIFRFMPTKFKDYVTISKTFEHQSLSKKLYHNMRIGAVGAFLELKNGEIFVHRRSQKATHCAGFLDSSCAGLIQVEDGMMNLENSLMIKVNRELGINKSEVEILGVTGVHSSYEPDFSCMFDIALKTNLDKKEFEKRINPDNFSEYYFIPKRQIARYVLEHFVQKADMNGDGAATLLGALKSDDFYNAVDRINKSSKKIEFGKLCSGRFKSS
ncbi:MAG: hypothetical protein Q7R87_01095 [Nanoarchaeota archaeon]|nr:hypothetical protein [Nanoarchaeota archaeon]